MITKLFNNHVKIDTISNFTNQVKHIISSKKLTYNKLQTNKSTFRQFNIFNLMYLPETLSHLSADPDLCQQKIMQNLPQVLWDSGHYVQQFGLYDQCTADNLSYSLSLVYKGSNHTGVYTGLYMGLCLPAECNANDHAAIMNTLNTVLQKMMGPNLFVGKVVDSPLEFEFQKKWLFYPVVVLIFLLMFLTLLATYLSRIPKFRERPSTAMKLLDTFNLTETFKTFKYKPHVFNVFNGVKSLCMLWVILGHEYSVRLHNNINAIDVEVQIEVWFFLFVVAAFFAVDVFFFLGGFLVAYSFLREKSKNILKYPMAIVHRILRFWPSYLMAILLLYAVFLQIGHGIFWFQNEATDQIDNCAKIWKPMFFVDNLVDNGQKMCMGWGWYLQNDMQIFIFSMIFLFLYSQNKVACKLSLILLSIGSLILNFVQVQQSGYIQVTHPKDFAKWGQYFPNIYIKPWTRCPPYLIGLFFGIQYMEYMAVKKSRDEIIAKQNNRAANRTSVNEQSLVQKTQRLPEHVLITLKEKMLLNKYIVHGFQLVGVAIMLFIVLIPRTLQLDNTAWPQWLHSLYLSCGKVFFVLGMYLTILPSLLDIKNMTFFLMDTEFFNFIAKVSFWTYLIHYMVVLQITYRQKIDFYYSVGDVVPIYIPTAIISIFLGFIGTIVVEIPFGKMEKMLMNTLMGKKDISRKVDKVGSLTEPLAQSMKDTTIDSSSLKDSLPPNASVQETIITKDSIESEERLRG